MKGEIKRVEEDISKKLEPILHTSKKQNNAIGELEVTTTDISDTMQRLKIDLDHVSGQRTRMTDKCLDLEARSRCQNLRIVGVKEGKETGKDSQVFTANLLQQVFNLPERPKIDQAHRVQRARSGAGAPPRQIILKLHDLSVLEDIMKKVTSTAILTFEGENIRIFRDYPAEVVKKRTLFTKTRVILKDIPDLKYGMMYPAKLRVTYGGLEHFFIDPEDAFKYAQELKKDVKG